ncbi:major facilitator superfamily domain-containing protein [Umbelopsis sp. PMI_123]|nr:major facilitator superfamily domain-containing protein [Umbelopsis sp. PMI_123]
MATFQLPQRTERTPSITQSHNTADRSLVWLNIAAASAILFIGVGYTNTFGVFQEYYQTTLFPNESPLKIVTIGSVASSLYLILGAFAGRFADLVGYRISLCIGTALMVGSMFAASVSDKFWQLFLSQGFMFGLGVAFAYLPAVTISRQYFGSGRHGLANGLVVSGGAVGGCILPYIVRELMADLGLAQTFRILGYISAAVLLPSIMTLKPRTGASSLRRSLARGNEKPPLMDFSLLNDSRFIALLVTSTVSMIGFLPRYFFLPQSAIARGVSDTYAAWLLGLMSGLSIIGRVGIGSLADRYGTVTALASSFILCGSGHFLFWLPGVAVPSENASTAIALFTLFSIYIGIFGSGFVSLFPVVVADLFGADALASKVGLLNTVTGLGTLAGPSMVYAIIGNEVDQHWVVGVASTGIFILVGGLTMTTTFSWLNKHDRHHAEAYQID